MKRWLAAYTPQPLVAIATSVLAALAVCYGLARTGAAHLADQDLAHPLQLVVIAGLVGAVVVAYTCPIHLRYQLKLLMSSVPLYLLTVLAAPVLAALLVGLAVLGGELAVRRHRGNYPSDIATSVARWTLLALLSSLVAHVPATGTVWSDVPLIGAAVVLWVGDALTLPLLVAPMSGERPRRLIVSYIREAGLAEATQYLLGLLGALAADEALWALALLAVPSVIVYMAFKSSKEMHDETRALLETMADTVDLRDPYTGGHSRRVTAFAEGILRELDMRGIEIDLIVAAARVHDIGKIGIPDAVLNKPGKLSDEERALMETHSERGADLLRRYPDFARGVGIVLHHHESWDGTGYPHRLRGAEIPFGARVIAVADSYDAMTSDRPYRKGMPAAKATQILREGRGQQWDGHIVDAFLRSIAPRLGETAPAPYLHLVPQTELEEATRPA